MSVPQDHPDPTADVGEAPPPVGPPPGAAGDAGPDPAPAEIAVVAAVIRRGGRYLLGRRPAHKRHGGLWEFPGGKVDEGEDLAAAARRELDEELGLELVAVGASVAQLRDPGSPFVIHFVHASVQGVPRPREHDEVGWFEPAELAGMPLAPGDARFAARLLPAAPGSGEAPR
jgi:8-oxo-dGTP pyrophosphatase MutT (NUDIX family)